MRSVTYLAIGAILAPAPALAPSVAHAQGGGPVDAGSREISYEVQDRYPQARGVRITSSSVSDGPRNQARVTGKGEFDDRNGGEARFSFGCTYNYRTGRTSDLDVGELSHKNKDNTAATTGTATRCGAQPTASGASPGSGPAKRRAATPRSGPRGSSIVEASEAGAGGLGRAARGGAF